MRVYTRELEQALVIGDDVRVTVLEIGDDFVRLGISTRADGPSYREEIVHFEPAELEYAGLPVAAYN